MVRNGQSYIHVRPFYETRIMTAYSELITIDPGKRGGRPTVQGTRIAVSDVLGWLSVGMSHDEITADFPELTREEILACLAFDSQASSKARSAIPR